mmetsp:Transcript_16761/g.38707  ORF Transcript_16761/g.38707 Transcript_16761/m.38707 type:complete len:246 (-) Transcript_16761:45-782(-)
MMQPKAASTSRPARPRPRSSQRDRNCSRVSPSPPMSAALKRARSVSSVNIDLRTPMARSFLAVLLPTTTYRIPTKQMYPPAIRLRRSIWVSCRVPHTKYSAPRPQRKVKKRAFLLRLSRNCCERKTSRPSSAITMNPSSTMYTSMMAPTRSSRANRDVSSINPTRVQPMPPTNAKNRRDRSPSRACCWSSRAFSLATRPAASKLSFVKVVWANWDSVSLMVGSPSGGGRTSFWFAFIMVPKKLSC